MTHPTALIPLAACVCAAALTSAVLARDPRSPANRTVAAIIGLGGVWALFAAAAQAASDPIWVTRWSRAVGAAYLLISPLCLRLAMEIRPSLSRRLRPVVGIGAVSGVGLALAHATTPYFVAGADGSHIEFGPLFPIALVHAAGYPLAAMAIAARSVSLGVGRHLLVAAIGGPLLIATLSEVLLPHLGLPSPRLGSACVIVLGGGAWAVFLRIGRPSISRQAFAREVLDLLPDGVTLLRGDGRVRLANRSLARMLGVRREDLDGCPIDDLLSEPPGPDAELTDAETRLRPATRGTLPASVTSSTLSDRQGFRLGQVLTIRDQREMVDLRRRIVTSGRLAAVGELAAGIAHEVNNPVAYIQANLNLLRRHHEAIRNKSAGGDEALAGVVPERIARCLEHVGQVASLVREVRGFSRGGGGQTAPVEVHRILDGALRLASSRLRGRIDIERVYRPVGRPAGSEQDLKQVFLDLILNAARAVEDTGRIRVETEGDEHNVRIAIEDDGRGLEPDQLDGIFEPAASGRGLDDGRGLGLAVSYQILRRHGGRIAVDSSPGRGTRVRVTLPITAEAG